MMHDDDRERVYLSSPAYRDKLRRMARECREEEMTPEEQKDLGEMERAQEQSDWESERL